MSDSNYQEQDEDFSDEDEQDEQDEQQIHGLTPEEIQALIAIHGGVDETRRKIAIDKECRQFASQVDWDWKVGEFYFKCPVTIYNTLTLRNILIIRKADVYKLLFPTHQEVPRTKQTSSTPRVLVDEAKRKIMEALPPVGEWISAMELKTAAGISGKSGNYVWNQVKDKLRDSIEQRGEKRSTQYARVGTLAKSKSKSKKSPAKKSTSKKSTSKKSK